MERKLHRIARLPNLQPLIDACKGKLREIEAEIKRLKTSLAILIEGQYILSLKRRRVHLLDRILGLESLQSAQLSL